MTDDIAARAKALGLGSPPRDKRAPHFIGLKFPGGLPANLLEALGRRKVYVSIRGTSVRITPHLYNVPRDVEKLFDALQEVLR
jgi:selenocysteine lyase/cysteine desulfurase